METTPAARRPLNVELELTMALLHIESLKFTRNIILDMCASLRERVTVLERMVHASQPRLPFPDDDRRATRKPTPRKRRPSKR